MFCIVADDQGVLGVVVGVGLLSIIDGLVRVFPTRAEQTCGHDKMRHFLRLRLATLKFRVRSARVLFLGSLSEGLCFWAVNFSAKKKGEHIKMKTAVLVRVIVVIIRPSRALVVFAPHFDLFLVTSLKSR